MNAIAEIHMCPPHVFGSAAMWISMSCLRQAILLAGFTALSWLEEDGTFIVAAVMSFSNCCHIYQAVLVMHGEPWIR